MVVSDRLAMVRFLRPSFPPSERIEHYFALAREHNWYSNGGPCLKLMAGRLEERVGCSAVPVCNGTAALMVAVRALSQASAAREVLVPSFTFAATVQAIVWNGLTPVFVDIDPSHWHMSAAGLRAALEARGDRTNMVVTCSALGTPPPSYVRNQWEQACAEAGVPLLVDSAACFGAKADDGAPIGRQGNAEVVSFHITKPFGIGEGGAIFTASETLADEMRQLTNFGFDEAKQPQTLWGLNAKLDELHAAVALAVLETFDEQLALRRERAGAMFEALGPGFQLQEGFQFGTQQIASVLVPDPPARQRVLASSAGHVELRTYYEPLHLAPAFCGLPRAGTLAVTEDIGSRVLSLPMATDLSDWEIEAVAEVLRRQI
jgi:dTDP-4-amino-4,6-dideoxygalactose transaminase